MPGAGPGARAFLLQAGLQGSSQDLGLERRGRCSSSLFFVGPMVPLLFFLTRTDFLFFNLFIIFNLIFIVFFPLPFSPLTPPTPMA